MMVANFLSRHITVT